jgi:Fic family protein
MMKCRPEIYKKDVIPSLWKRYENSSEYKKDKRTESINSEHPLIKAAEQAGLRKMIRIFIGELQKKRNIRDEYENRNKSEWLDEWSSMHDTLFKLVLKNRGKTRPKGFDVRFGDPGDEELHSIPKGGIDTLSALNEFAANIGYQLQHIDSTDIDSVCTYLARIHYEFIRIHPFCDGNGRIARAITDQLAVSLGYPPIIAGFPRLNLYKKERYHSAITGCIGDPTCTSLSSWIKTQIMDRIVDIA